MSSSKKRSAQACSQPESTLNAAKRSRREVPLSQTRLSQSQSQLNSSALTPSRCGKVLRMHLTNFMCHSNLSIDFHQRVNFLVGANGSGKSAILAALVLGLGASAKATNRSGSLKQLIKTGQTSAKIEITIANDGAQAYDADVYGDSITIVRNITTSASGYSIKNSRGVVISRKIDDLHRILMYHNVQVDNPVFVLNQDGAREFLKELEPSKNYRLFLKATQIELVMEKLNDCMHQHKDQMYRMSCFKKKLLNNKTELVELNSKLEQLLSLKKLKDILRKMELERVWLLVAQKENELQNFLEEIEKVVEKKNTIERLVHDKNGVESELSQKLSMVGKEIAAKNEKYSTENTVYLQIKTKVTQMSERCLEVSSYMESFKKRKSYLETQIKDLNNNIEDRSKNNMGDIAENRRRNEATLCEMQKDMEDNTAIIETDRRDLKMFVDNKIQMEEKAAEINRQKSNFSDNIQRIGSQIANISASSKDKLSIFGEHVTQLLMELDRYHQAGKFSELPRGPIGRYVDVRDNKYRDVVENQLRALMQGFIVANTKDRLQFDALLKQKFPNYHPLVITTKFMNQVYDVRNGRVTRLPRGTRLLLDEIKCSDPVVMNCLIDRASIETIVICETKEIAEHITSNIENVPNNMQKVIVPQPGLEYYPEPHYRMYSLKINRARYIQVNVKDRIRQLEAERHDLEEQRKLLESELAKLVPVLRTELKRIQDKRALLERHEVKKRELQDKISELQNIEYPDYNEVDILKNELVEIERKHAGVMSKLQDKKIELIEAQSEKARFEDELQQQKSIMEGIQQEVDGIKSKYDTIKTKLRNLGDNFLQNQQKLSEINKTLNKLEAEKSEKLATLNVATNDAQKKGNRIVSERIETDISDAIQKLKAKLKQRAQINDDPDKLRELISAKEHTFEMEQSTYENIKISIDKLKKSLLTRFDFNKKLKQHMVLILQYSFNYILKLRNFVGSIEVNHHDKTLAISVIPRDNHLDNAVSSTRALSGGERSYSTVAFLISLWSCVDHPFYFLDEYDVFTDVVNREYMTRLLINEGKSRPNRQYSFLTPQDMTIASKDFIKIHKLAEPDRH